MSWNHRVVFDKETGFFGVHEVYSLGCMTLRPIAAQEESLEDLILTLNRMLEACEKPVLDTNMEVLDGQG